MAHSESSRQSVISRRERMILCVLIHAACALAWGLEHQPGPGRITPRRSV
jgi:hypothetical protein